MPCPLHLLRIVINNEKLPAMEKVDLESRVRGVEYQNGPLD